MIRPLWNLWLFTLNFMSYLFCLFCSWPLDQATPSPDGPQDRRAVSEDAALEDRVRDPAAAPAARRQEQRRRRFRPAAQVYLATASQGRLLSAYDDVSATAPVDDGLRLRPGVACVAAGCQVWRRAEAVVGPVRDGRWPPEAPAAADAESRVWPAVDTDEVGSRWGFFFVSCQCSPQM